MYNFEVSDMTCSHCVATVEKAVKSVDGHAGLKIDLASLAVTIESDKPATMCFVLIGAERVEA